MSAKKTIFPPGNEQQNPGGKLPETMEDLYTGHPGYNGHGHNVESNGHHTGQRDAVKGHAAYAANEEIPPFQPRGAGFGPGADLFGKESQISAEESSQIPSGDQDLLSVISDDLLREECQKRLCQVCPVKSEADDLHLRALADLDNTKKRLIREHKEQARFATESVLADIVPSLDNLDLALQHASNNDACENFVTGVQMTRKLLLEALAKHGLEQIGEKGEEFNPAFHEAVGMMNESGMPDNHVCALLSSGYKLRDRLLRPAKVMVCKKG